MPNGETFTTKITVTFEAQNDKTLLTIAPSASSPGTRSQSPPEWFIAPVPTLAR